MPNRCSWAPELTVQPTSVSKDPRSKWKQCFGVIAIFTKTLPVRKLWSRLLLLSVHVRRGLVWTTNSMDCMKLQIAYELVMERKFTFLIHWSRASLDLNCWPRPCLAYSSPTRCSDIFSLTAMENEKDKNRQEGREEKGKHPHTVSIFWSSWNAKQDSTGEMSVCISGRTRLQWQIIFAVWQLGWFLVHKGGGSQHCQWRCPWQATLTEQTFPLLALASAGTWVWFEPALPPSSWYS